MDKPRFLAGYVLIVGAVLVVSFGLQRAFGLGTKPTVYRAIAVLLVGAAASGQSYVYRVVRNMGWFNRIQSDRTVRVVLVVLAGALGALSLVGRDW